MCEVQRIWWSFDRSPVPNLSSDKNFLHQFSQLSVQMRWCSVLQKVRPTYYEWHFIHVQFPHTIQQLQIPFGLHSSFQKHWVQKSVSMYRAPHGYSRVSSVMCIVCNMTVILRPVHGAVSGYKQKHSPSLNTISFARVPCDLTIHKVELGDFYQQPCNSCTDCILYRLNLQLCIIPCSLHVSLEVQFLMQSFSAIVLDLDLSWPVQRCCFHIQLKFSDDMLQVCRIYSWFFKCRINSVNRMLSLS